MVHGLGLSPVFSIRPLNEFPLRANGWQFLLRRDSMSNMSIRARCVHRIRSVVREAIKRHRFEDAARRQNLHIENHRSGIRVCRSDFLIAENILNLRRKSVA